MPPIYAGTLVALAMTLMKPIFLLNTTPEGLESRRLRVCADRVIGDLLMMWQKSLGWTDLNDRSRCRSTSPALNICET